jgi:LPS-assembly lipoprotein
MANYRILPLLVILALASGCGFHLRGDIPGTAKEKTLLMTGVSRDNPFYRSFVQNLTTGGGTLASKPQDASAIISVVKVAHIRRPITLSAAGRANMFDLTFRVIYEVQNPKGDVLIPEKELEVRREYFNTQGSPLGQGLEEAQMRLEMEKDASQTLLRQIVIGLRERSAKAS